MKNKNKRMYCGRWDSNPRPSGYEPDELPLLHAASYKKQGCSQQPHLKKRNTYMPTRLPNVPSQFNSKKSTSSYLQ